eukprot:403333553
MFAIGGWAFLASSYQILSELSKKDRLNLKSLERRLICITQPLNHCLISQSNFNSLKQKPIDQSASLIEEIIQFIQRVNTTPNYVFDEDFSAELDHYCRELEFLIQTLQLSINLNNQFENIPIPLKLNQINEINRMSGYLLAQKGHLMAQISIQRSKDVVEYKWVQGNQSVPKINISNVSQSHIQDMSSDLERMIKRKKKYSFILNYQMAISIIRADSSLHSDLEQELKNFQGLNDEMYKKAPKIHIDHDSVQLLDIIQKQTKGEWIQWKCTSEDFMLVDIMKRYPDRQIEKFAYCIDRDSQKISLNEQFSLIDIIYLLRLSAYENEQMSKFGYKQQKYVSQQLEFNREQRKSERIKGRGLIENELQNMKLDDKERELDVDCEVNEMHGLAHLQASDEELYQLLCTNIQ